MLELLKREMLDLRIKIIHGKNLYTSPRLGFLEKVVLIKDEEILKVYSRK